jgi:hypothetical protein
MFNPNCLMVVSFLPVDVVDYAVARAPQPYCGLGHISPA